MGTVAECCCTDSFPHEQNNPMNKIKVHTDQSSLDDVKTGNTDGSILDTPTQNLSDQKIEKILTKKAKNKKKIQFDDFLIEGKLGQGGFGVVYLGQLKSNIHKGKKQRYAIKKVSKELLFQKKVNNRAIDEKNILAMYDCQFIVTLAYAFQDSWWIYFVMQFAAGGDTYSLIEKGSPRVQTFKSLGQAGVRFIAGCVILGLEYLHKNDYMYRDLKPENVLIFDNGYAKLTDFGLVKKSPEGEISKTLAGTPLYSAPEMVLKKGYGKQIDFWTLGVYLYEISNYSPPFKVDQMTRPKFQAVCLEAENNRVWKNQNLSTELKDLINNLLKFNEKKRLGSKGWAEVKKHAFFNNFDWKELQQQNGVSSERDCQANSSYIIILQANSGTNQNSLTTEY